MRVQFLGGTDTVTGSRFLVDGVAGRGLVDCGLFQGLKALRERNWAPFPSRPRDIEWVALTHAHMDHSGYVPALVRQGFQGKILCSEPTADLLGVLWRDAAHLQVEEAEFVNRHGTTRHRPAEPLFRTADVEAALRLLSPQPFDQDIVEGGYTFHFRYVGHILGASQVRVSDGETRVLFSGDLGRPTDLVMRPPDPPLAADVLVLESTYGNRQHPAGDPGDALAAVVHRTVARGGDVILPAFAVGRVQQVLLLLGRLRDQGRIPPVPIFLNSPMSVQATEVLVHHAAQTRLTADEIDGLRRLAEHVESVEDSKALLRRSGPKIVVSASGMATGGRVLHHLVRALPDARNTVLFSGFQAAGTRGDTLVSGAGEVKIFGAYVPVRSEVVQLDGLSAHADWREILAWLKTAEQPFRRVCLVHGEPAGRDGMRRAIRDFLGWPAELPRADQVVEIR
jgi:metallo-beta-lactamase family protein